MLKVHFKDDGNIVALQVSVTKSKEKDTEKLVKFYLYYKDEMMMICYVLYFSFQNKAKAVENHRNRVQFIQTSIETHQTLGSFVERQ